VGEVRDGNEHTAQEAERNSGPVNWLQWLDKIALTLPPAESWLQPYDYFLLTRHPHLQPPDPIGRDYKKTYQVGKQTYERQLREQQERISADLEARQVLEGLSEVQCRQLAALVFELTVELQEHVKWKALPNELQKRTRPFARLVRGLETDARQMEKIIERTLAKMPEVDRLIGRDIHYSLVLISLQVAKFKAALQASFPGDVNAEAKNSDYYRKAVQDTPDRAMVELYWLLHYGCWLAVGESEFRVALIRNNLWLEYAGAVSCTIGSGEESRGCDAVRLAVRRFRLPEGTQL
jgi:hypothetical protein